MKRSQRQTSYHEAILCFPFIPPLVKHGRALTTSEMPCLLPTKKTKTFLLISGKIYVTITKEQQGQMGAERFLMTRSIMSKLTMPTSQWKQLFLPNPLWDIRIFCMCIPPTVRSYKLIFKYILSFNLKFILSLEGKITHSKCWLQWIMNVFL